MVGEKVGLLLCQPVGLRGKIQLRPRSEDDDLPEDDEDDDGEDE